MCVKRTIPANRFSEQGWTPPSLGAGEVQGGEPLGDDGVDEVVGHLTPLEEQLGQDGAGQQRVLVGGDLVARWRPCRNWPA
jgi:hypothetical protein